MRRAAGRRPQRGLTLVEVLVAFAIFVIFGMSLVLVANRSLESALETDMQRTARMLLLQKAEEIIAGVDEGTGGGFEGYPGFQWETQEQIAPIEGAGLEMQADGTMPAEVRAVTIRVTWQPLRGGGDQVFYDDYGLDAGGGYGVGGGGFGEVQDLPGQVSVTILLDPPDADEQVFGQGGAGGVR